MTTELEIQEMLDQLTEIYAERDLLAQSKDKLRSQIITPEITAALADLDDEFAPQEEGIAKRQAEIEEAIKAAVKALPQPHSVHNGVIMATYKKGSTTWNADMLAGMIALVPQLEQARKVGSPSVSIGPKRGK